MGDFPFHQIASLQVALHGDIKRRGLKLSFDKPSLKGGLMRVERGLLWQCHLNLGNNFVQLKIA